ncbi:MAG: hypothetical protein QXF23_06610 [Candidatus Bathyarchaeia archaeon]
MGVEANSRGLRVKSDGNKRIKPMYAKTLYELVNAESEAWSNYYKFYAI